MKKCSLHLVPFGGLAYTHIASSSEKHDLFRAFLPNGIGERISDYKFEILYKSFDLKLLYRKCYMSLHIRINGHVRTAADYSFLPQIYFGVTENSYLLQMNKEGFRACDESIAVNAASIALSHCMHRIPPERKDRSSVISFLNELADELTRN